jgi:hypothetical protein
MQLANVAQQRFRLTISALQENKDAFELQLRHQTQQMQDIHQQTQQRVIDAIDDANATAESLHQETQINVVEAVGAANLKQTELHIRCTMLFLVAYFRSASLCQIQEIMEGPTEQEFLEEHTGDQSKRHNGSSGSGRGAEGVIRTSPELIEVNSAEAPRLCDFVQAPHKLGGPMTIAEARQFDFGLAKAIPFERTYY